MQPYNQHGHSHTVPGRLCTQLHFNRCFYLAYIYISDIKTNSLRSFFCWRFVGCKLTALRLFGFADSTTTPTSFQSFLFANLSSFSLSYTPSSPSSLLSCFLHALLDSAEDLSGDGKVTLLFPFVRVCAFPSFLSCFTIVQFPPGTEQCVFPQYMCG